MLRGVLRRRGGRAWLWLLVGLIVGGGAGAGVVLLLKKAKPGFPGGPVLGQADELALVPPDAIGFIHVRARDVWKSEHLDGVRKLVEKAGPEAMKALDEGFVPAPSTLDRVTLVFLQDPAAVKQPPPKAGPKLGNGPPKFTPKPFMPEARKPLVEMPEGVEAVGLLTFTAPYDAAKVRTSLLPQAISTTESGKEYWEDARHDFAAYFPSDTVMVIGTKAGVRQFVHKQPSAGKQPNGPLSGPLALAAEGGRHLVGAINAQYFRVNLSRIKDEFPDLSVNGGELLRLATDVEPLLHAESLAFSLGFGRDETKLDVRAYFKDDEAAEKGEKAVRALAAFGHKKLADPKKDLEKLLKGEPDQKKPRPIKDLPMAVLALAGIGAINKAEEFLANPPLKRDGRELIATFDVPSIGEVYVGSMAVAAGMLIPSVTKVRDAAARASSSNNLKQMAIAMHAYNDTYNRLPSPIGVQPDGNPNPKPLLSWRVHLLPYVEQQNLYTLFRLDEPWDSPNNKPLISMMPKLYASPTAFAPAGQTYYKVLVGGGALFSIPHNRFSIGNIPDGTSNTIMIVEGGQPVIWTKPEDIPYDPKKPIPDLSLAGNRRITVAMADGSVRTIDLNRVSEPTLRNAIEAADGQVLGADWGP